MKKKQFLYKEKVQGHFWVFLKLVGAPSMLLGSPINCLVLGVEKFHTCFENWTIHSIRKEITKRIRKENDSGPESIFPFIFATRDIKK